MIKFSKVEKTYASPAGPVPALKGIDLEIAKENYFKDLTPVNATYKISDNSYTIQNTACVKTLAHDFTKITLSFRGDAFDGDEKYAYYKVNGKEFFVANDGISIDNMSTVTYTTRVYQQRKRKSAVEQGEAGGKGIIISTNDVPNG